MLLAGLGIVVGLLLGWAVLVGACVGLLVLALFDRVVGRGVSSASWRDLDCPVRVNRGSDAHLSIDVHVSGDARWVSAVDDMGRRTWLTGSTCTLTWPIDTARRGSWPVGPTSLVLDSPLGMRRSVLALRAPTTVLVVPRVSPAPVLGPAAQVDEGVVGESPGGSQFHSIREYVVGDPRKLVHWRSSARTGTLMVRRMVDTTMPWLVVALDVDRSSYGQPGAMFGDYSPDEFEAAVDLCASWMWSNVTPFQRVLLTTTGAAASAIEVTVRSRSSALDWLALVESHDASAALPARVAQLARARSAARIVLVTGSRSPSAALLASTWGRTVSVTVARTS